MNYIWFHACLSSAQLASWERYTPVYDFRSSGPRRVTSYEVSFYWPGVGFDFASMTLPWWGEWCELKPVLLRELERVPGFKELKKHDIYIYFFGFNELNTHN